MTQDQVNTFFGDRSTILPAGLPRTDLLNQEPLENPPSPDPDYEAWLAAGAPPGKPLPSPPRLPLTACSQGEGRADSANPDP